MQLRSILVPTDFSACASDALDYALALARRCDARVDVLAAWELPYYLVGEWFVNVPGEKPMLGSDVARQRVELELKTLVKAIDYPNAHGVVAPGDAVDQILEHARRGGYDLIVMGTHGRRGLAHALLGSVAEKVVRLAPCPVLTVRQREKPTTEPLR
jgi:nucleotide-binding universal stress UspA family protein